MEDRFFFWRNYWDALSKLGTNEDRGRLVTAMCEYAFDGVEPDFGGDPVIDMAWTLIAAPLRESVERGRVASERGRRGGRGNKGGTRKRHPLSTPSSTAERVPESTPLSTDERVPESVRYGSTYLTDGTVEGTVRGKVSGDDDWQPLTYE